MRRRPITLGALVAIAVAAGVAGAASLRRRPARGAAHAVRHRSRAARNAEIARLGSRTGSSFAVHQARRVFASAERRRELDVRFELRTAEQVAEALGDMKGALMKVGQMVSYLDESLPEPFRVALAQLQQDAPPMSGELAAQVVEEELGQPPDRVFAEWDPVPIAAASIGQVHRAITRDGLAVAVKVQYPGVGEAIRADLDNAPMLFGAIAMMFPGLDAGPIVEEIKQRLGEELDYRHEADNQRLFCRYFEGHPFVHIPAVVDGLSTARVLTTELAEGARFDEMESWPPTEKTLAAEAIFRFVLRSLYRFHVFNGDPHPGNYLFRPGGRVTFLDFGLVKRFTADEVRTLERMAEAIVVRRDVPAFRAVMEEAGFLHRNAPISDDEVGEYFGHFYGFAGEGQITTIDAEYATETVRRIFDRLGPHSEILKHANVPPAFVVLQRINLGLYAILSRLHATAPWRAISEELWPFVDGPPASDLGRQEAEWRARAGR